MKQILAIALGNRQTSAVLMENTPMGLAINDFCLLEAPQRQSKDNEPAVEVYAEHFRQIRHALGGTKSKNAVLVLKSSDSLIKLAELPPMPVSALRDALQRQSKLFLKEDYSNYLFDCHVQQSHLKAEEKKPASTPAPAGEAPKPNPGSAKPRKITVLVGGARRTLVEMLVRAARVAGFQVSHVLPAQMALVQGMKTPTGGNVSTALANFDIGWEASTISILHQGEVVQCRTVPMGGRNLTAGLAEAMNVTLEAAESVKVLLPNTVDSKLEILLAPLAQELKGSVDFFESQVEQKVSVVYLSGGSARSPQVLQSLEKHTHLPCRPWHLPDNISINLSPDRVAVFKRDMPQFMAAVGAAMDALGAIPRCMNLLASQLDEANRRRRSPVRLAFAGAALVCALALLWGAVLGWRLLAETATVKTITHSAVQRRAAESRVLQKSAAANQTKIALLTQQAANRFLVAPLLDALQRSMVDDIVVTKINLQRTPLVIAKGGKKVTREAMLLSLQAKDYSELGATEAFIEALAANAYFKKRLPGPESVVLKQRSSRQADTGNPSLSFALVTIECLLVE